MYPLKRFLFFIIFIGAPYANIYAHENTYTHTLAICAIAQNEGEYFEEWIRFHHARGVEKFYIYNNNSTDNSQKILQPYINTGLVDYINWPYDWHYNNKYANAQIMAYNDCLKKTRGIIKWVAFLDIDEFLFPVQVDDLRIFLTDYEEYGAVCANWINFGTSKIKKIPQNRLLESLTMRADLSIPKNKYVKSILQPKKTNTFTHSAHHALFNPGYFQVTPNKIRFTGNLIPAIEIDKLRLHHYWPRDETFLKKVKIARILLRNPHASTKEKINLEKILLHRISLMNKEKDCSILRLIRK